MSNGGDFLPSKNNDPPKIKAGFIAGWVLFSLSTVLWLLAVPFLALGRIASLATGAPGTTQVADDLFTAIIVIHGLLGAFGILALYGAQGSDHRLPRLTRNVFLILLALAVITRLLP